MTGEETGKKASAEKAVTKKRLLRDENGEKVFKPKDCLTVDQMTSMFSRMASQKEKEQLKEPVKQNVDDDFEEAMEESDDEENSTDNDDVSDDEENTGVQNCLEHLKNWKIYKFLTLCM